MSPKDQAIHDAIATIEKALSKALDNVLPKVMGDLFDAGGADYAASLQKAMQALNPVQFTGPVEFVEVAPGTTLGSPGKDGRAPRGAVRLAVTKALIDHGEGLSLSALGAAALRIDPTISLGGINNEVNRNKDVRYTNASGVWKLTDTYLAEVVESNDADSLFGIQEPQEG